MAFTYDKKEVDNWIVEIIDNRGRTAHAYPNDILFPLKLGGKSVYEKQVIVPETLKSGQYKLKICGLLKDSRKLCQETEAFHIEGEQVKSKSADWRNFQ